MVSTLKRQLTDEEKEIIFKRFGHTCFANGHAVPEGDQIQYDHIYAHSLGGDSELNNIAPMCAQHNKEKGQLPLGDFRIKLQLDEFFDTGDKLTLGHLLSFLKEKKRIKDFGNSIAIKKEGEVISLETPTDLVRHTLYVCPITKWNYFYATLKTAFIGSDDEIDEDVGLQPRYLIKDRVFSLFRHFQTHPVLQPSIGRVAGSHIRIFDGQHKIAALLLNNREVFECKIYLDADLRLLNDTNIAAHDKFSQIRFYSSIMVLKLGAEFSKDFEDFKNLDHPPIKSEKGFFDYLLSRPDPTMTKAELNRRFRSNLYSSILSNPDNKLENFVSAGNRSTDEKPITIDMLEKSIFANFLHREPTADNMASEIYRRDDEVKNNIELCNIIVEGGLQSWNAKAPANDQNRQRLQRIFGSKSMMAWSELLSDSIGAQFQLHDTDEKLRIFYRSLSASQIELIRKTVNRLYGWQRWSAPPNDQIDRILADNKSAVKDWFKAHGLTTGFLMGASE